MACVSPLFYWRQIMEFTWLVEMAGPTYFPITTFAWLNDVAGTFAFLGS